jgi:hypothetical protein
MLKIYCARDDFLLEVEGDIQEEFSFWDTDYMPFTVAVSDGTLLRARHDDDGIWRISLLVKGTAQFEKVEGNVIEDTHDVVTLSGVDIEWVAICEAYQSKK